MLFYCGNQWGYNPLGNTVNIPTGFCNPPTALQTTVNGQYITFKWTAPHDFDHFVLEYKVNGSMGPYTVVSVFGQSFTAALAGSTAYEWRVKTYCSLINQSTYSTGSVVTAGIAFPACTPVSSIVVTNMSTYYEVSWAATGAQYYRISWYVPGPKPMLFEATTQDTSFKLTNLFPGETYSVMVTGYCADPNLVPIASAPVLFEAGILDCPLPGNLNYTISSTSIIVAWPGISAGKYNIYLNGTLVATNYPQTSFSFTGLVSDTEYTIEVRTNCDKGFSEPSELVVRTAKAVCNEPTGLNITGLSASGFTVNWTPAAGIVSQQLILNNGNPIALASGVNTYALSGLQSGSKNTVIIRSICATSASQGVGIAAQLTGCAPVSNITVDIFSTQFNVKWQGVANALEYFVTVRRDSDSLLVFSGTTQLTKISVSGLEVATAYTISITARCGVEGSTLTSSVDITQGASTLAANTCENAVIDSSTIGQNAASFTFSFASGRTAGTFKAVVRKQSDNSLIATQTVFTTGTVNFDGLLAATQYKIFIYNETTVDNVVCVPAQITTFTTTAVCAPPSAIVLTLQNNDTEILVNATASTSTPPTYAFEYRINTGDWISAGNHTLPHTITGLTPGKYQIRLRSNCVASISDWVESSYVCATPVLQTMAVQQNAATIVWKEQVGITNYIVELTSLSGGVATYTATTNSIIIPDLPYNTNFIVAIKAICSDAPLTTVSAIIFGFATASPPDGSTADGLCAPVEFTAFIQDCAVTDPGGIIHDEDPPSLPPGGCVVTPKDWTLISGIFLEVDDPPNDQFFEGTFSIPQNIEAGATALMPGGVLGVVSTDCRPASSVTLALEVIQGGVYVSGDGTMATNGNLTITGSYDSNGGPSLIIRIKGNYIKA